MEVLVMIFLSSVLIFGECTDDTQEQLEALTATVHFDRWEARAADCRRQLFECKQGPRVRVPCAQQYENCEIHAWEEWKRRTGRDAD